MAPNRVPCDTPTHRACARVSAAGQVRQLAQIRNQFKSLQKDRAAKSQGVMNDFLDFVYHVENGYEIDAFRSVLNEVFVVGYRIQQNEESKDSYETLDNMMKTFDILSATAETAGIGFWGTNAMGITATFVGPIVNIKINNNNYKSGKIDYDRYYLRNTGIAFSSIIGYAAGKGNPFIGLIAGEGTTKLFDGIEAAADYLNTGANQMKSQVIFTIKNSIHN